MIVTAREFTSAAEMRAAALAAHNRLFNPAVRAKTPIIEVLKHKPVVAVPPPKPLWMREATMFSEHITAYQVILRIREMQEHGEVEIVKFERRSILEIVLEVLADFPTVSVRDVKGGRRTHDVVYPRQLSMWEVKTQRPDLSYPAIGRWFGGRDHTTVLHATRKIEKMKGAAA